MNKKIVISGAGLVGSLLAIYLRKYGYEVSIYERRSDMRQEKLSAGKSINLALSDRGIKALQEVGIMDEIRKICIPMHGRALHNADGSNGFQPYGKEGQFINSVSRAELNRKLMDLAEQQGVEIKFNRKLKQVDWARKLAAMEGHDGSAEVVHFDILFGADGAYSAARLQHQLQQDRFQYQQFYIDYGYKELLIPPDAEGNYCMDPNALHIWPRGNFMLIALPNTDRTFTCTLFLPFEGEISFESLKDAGEIERFFRETFPDAYDMMPTLREDFMRNPTSSLITVKCFPWRRDDSFCLIGDAAHAIVPFFGQGMNCGFEDCTVLNELIGQHGHDWKKIFEDFEKLRKPDADAIAELAVANFVEMRDKVADKKFLLQKKIEAWFSAKHPDKWSPAYTLVTFRPEIRYSEALQKGQKQQAIMDEIMSLPDIKTNWDSSEIELKILSLIHNEQNGTKAGHH